jgi:hypothetical protein
MEGMAVHEPLHLHEAKFRIRYTPCDSHVTKGNKLILNLSSE